MKRILFIAFLSVSLPTFLLSCHGKVNSDEKMIDRFKTQKNEFNTLTKMLLDDPKIEHMYVSGNTIKSNVAITEKQSASYLAAMGRIGISSIYVDRRTDDVSLTSKDSSHFDWEKGFFYSTKPPKILAQSTDLHYKDLRPYSIVYRRIDENWYLYLFRKTD